MSPRQVFSEGDIIDMLEAKIEEFDDEKKMEKAKAQQKEAIERRRKERNLIKKQKDEKKKNQKKSKVVFLDPFNDSEDRSVKLKKIISLR